jgi:hypothetical protein
MSLHFVCHSNEDYTFINSYYSHNGDRSNINLEDIKRASRSAGCAFPGAVGEKDLEGVITVEKVSSTQSLASMWRGTFEVDESLARKIRDHEQQHLFNKLFVPDENQIELFALRQKALNSKSLLEAAEIYVHDLIMYKRRNLIDFDTRNEILSYLRGGDTLRSILIKLLHSDLYDYKNQENNKRRIDLIPSEVKNSVECLFLDDNFNSEAKTIRSKITDSYIEDRVDKVFGEEYNRDLEIWIEAISILEEKHFTKDEIINLLYQEPVNSWINLARRMKERITLPKRTP